MEAAGQTGDGGAAPTAEAGFFASYKKLLRQYIEQKVELAKLSVVEKIAIVGGALFSMVLILFFSLLFFIFLGVFAGFYLGDILHSRIAGFGIIAALYMILAAMLVVFRKKLEAPVVNLLIRLMLNDIKK